MHSALEASVDGALEEDGPAALAWAVSLSFDGVGSEGVASSATCFPGGRFRDGG